jgi:hypothetical protein
MSTLILIVIGVVAFLLIAGIIFLRRRPQKLNLADFEAKWSDAQKLCAKQENWPLAVITADQLFDEALKKLKYRGKTMGERMVAAQHEIQDNDSLWFGHKLSNKLVQEEMQKLKKTDVMTALIGFREALKDLGAL